MVERGTLKPGQKLGAERELAVKLGVSRSTLRQALGSLEEVGIIRRIPGRGGGTFIASPKVERDLSRIVGIPMLLRDQGFTAGSRVLSVAVMTAGPDAAAALGIAEDEFVVDLVRIRLADGVPISLEHAVFPAELVPGMPERALGGSIYELCDSEYGLRPDEAIERIEVIAATDDEAAILGIAGGAPLLLVTRTTRNAAGVAFEYSHDLFRADRTRITVKVKGSPTHEKARLRGRVVELVPTPDQ
jgi:GntR family transcriptional regulator